MSILFSTERRLKRSSVKLTAGVHVRAEDPKLGKSYWRSVISLPPRESKELLAKGSIVIGNVLQLPDHWDREWGKDHVDAAHCRRTLGHATKECWDEPLECAVGEFSAYSVSLSGRWSMTGIEQHRVIRRSKRTRQLKRPGRRRGDGDWRRPAGPPQIQRMDYRGMHGAEHTTQHGPESRRRLD